MAVEGTSLEHKTWNGRRNKMAKVSFKIISENSPFELSDKKEDLVPAYTDGQIIFVEAEKKIYLDFHNRRTCYANVSASGGMNYLGIADNLPDDENVILKGGKSVTAKENDMIVVGTKEYIYRKGYNDVLGWFEIGDESEMDWNV